MLDTRLRICFFSLTPSLAFPHSPSGLIQLRELLSLSLDMDILTKAVDSASYHAILQELKEKEIYNMIVDIRNDDMSDFLKAVSKRHFSFPPKWDHGDDEN